MRPANLTNDELLARIESGDWSEDDVAEMAARYRNSLNCLDLQAVIEAKADETGPMNQLEAMRDLCWNYEWVASDSGLMFNIKGLHEDFHPDNHHVSISRARKVGKTTACKWSIRIQSKECGETVIEQDFIGTLQEAQDKAVELAVDGMVKGNWLNYGL